MTSIYRNGLAKQPGGQFHYCFRINGRQYKGSTRATDPATARKVLEERRRQILMGECGIRRIPTRSPWGPDWTHLRLRGEVPEVGVMPGAGFRLPTDPEPPRGHPSVLRGGCHFLRRRLEVPRGSRRVLRGGETISIKYRPAAKRQCSGSPYNLRHDPEDPGCPQRNPRDVQSKGSGWARPTPFISELKYRLGTPKAVRTHRDSQPTKGIEDVRTQGSHTSSCCLRHCPMCSALSPASSKGLQDSAGDSGDHRWTDEEFALDLGVQGTLQTSLSRQGRPEVMAAPAD